MLENLKYLSNKNLCDTQLYMNRLIGSMCIVAHVRNDIWVIGASSVDRKCIHCLKTRKTLAEQIMGDVPDCR